MAEETPAAEAEKQPTDEQSGKQEPAKAPETDPEIEAIAQKANNPDAVRNALTAERQAAREAREATEALQRKVKEFEDRDKSDQEKQAEALKAAEGRAAAAEASLLRFRVAAKKELPAELAERLQGKNEKELEADADRLLELVKPNGQKAGDADGGKGEPEDDRSFNEAIRAAVSRR